MADPNCPGDSVNCQHHFHDEDTKYLVDQAPEGSKTGVAAANPIPAAVAGNTESLQATQAMPQVDCDPDPETGGIPRVGFRGIIRNFTPSYVVYRVPVHDSVAANDAGTKAGSSSP